MVALLYARWLHILHRRGPSCPRLPYSADMAPNSPILAMLASSIQPVTTSGPATCAKSNLATLYRRPSCSPSPWSPPSLASVVPASCLVTVDSFGVPRRPRTRMAPALTPDTNTHRVSSWTQTNSDRAPGILRDYSVRIRWHRTVSMQRRGRRWVDLLVTSPGPRLSFAHWSEHRRLFDHGVYAIATGPSSSTVVFSDKSDWPPASSNSDSRTHYVLRHGFGRINYCIRPTTQHYDHPLRIAEPNKRCWQSRNAHAQTEPEINVAIQWS